MSTLSGLPQTLLDFLPELNAEPPPDEPRSSCADCPMTCAVEELPNKPNRFHPEARCCTYHPKLPNWLAGRALRSGRQAAALVRERMQNRAGISAAGISPPVPWNPKERFPDEAAFGRKIELRCPFWVGGDLACGIWEHRESVCRTFFCRTDDGPRSDQYWMQLWRVLSGTQQMFARICRKLDDPPADDAPQEELEAWFIKCAETIDRITPEELEALRSPDLDRQLQRLQEYRAQLNQPMPERLGASVKTVTPTESGFDMIGASKYDPLSAPRTIFLFLSRLDGTRDWREALEETNVQLVGVADPIPEALVEEMYRRGLLRALESADALNAGTRLNVRKDQ